MEHEVVLRATLLILVLGALPGGARAQDLPPSPPPAEGAGESPALPQFPLVLKGVDLDQPSQHAFRAWPSAEMVERPYWYPWSWLTLQRASMFDHPMVLVLTVPWSRLAQRMQAETFRDPTVLRTLNGSYLSILVSGDRRPDLLERYQTGTWPVISFLLPTGLPILSHANPTGYDLPITLGYANTDQMLFYLDQGTLYYDKWRNVLHGIGELWLKKQGEIEATPGAVKESASDEVARWLLGNMDRTDGGIGVAPKYVNGSLAEYAGVRQARLTPALVEPAQLTLDKLVASPLYDKREGGVHRLSAAPGWKEIQYEKMLESNADLLRELTFRLRQADSAPIRKAIEETSHFLTRVLARPGGGFYNGQCADPTTEDGGGYWTAAVSDAAKAPPLDRLVLSGPNALASAALLRAGAALSDPQIEQAGRDGMEFVLRAAYRPARGVLHVVEPNPEDRPFLVAQADVAFAFLDAYESTGNPRYRDAAKDIVDFCWNNLLVSGETALRDFLPEPHPLGLLANPRWPVGPNVRLARAMTRLAAQGLGDTYRQHALTILGAFAGDLAAYHAHAIEPGLAVEELVRDPIVLRVDGPSADPRTQALRRAALQAPAGFTLVATGTTSPGTEPSVTILFPSSGTATETKATVARVTVPAALAEQVRKGSAQEAPSNP